MERPTYKQPKHPAVSFHIVLRVTYFQRDRLIDFHSFFLAKEDKRGFLLHQRRLFGAEFGPGCVIFGVRS